MELQNQLPKPFNSGFQEALSYLKTIPSVSWGVLLEYAIAEARGGPGAAEESHKEPPREKPYMVRIQEWHRCVQVVV